MEDNKNVSAIKFFFSFLMKSKWYLHLTKEFGTISSKTTTEEENINETLQIYFTFF